MTFDAYIFNAPGFMSGAARSLDIGATFDRGSYLISDTPAEADARAVASDWKVVGQDLQVALEAYEQEQEAEEEQAA